MLLLHDTAGCIYLINAAGSAWFEMDDAGNIKAYSKNKVEMYAEKGFKFETPKKFQITSQSFDLSVSGPIRITGNTIDLSAKRDIKIGAGKDTNPQATGDLHISGSNLYLSTDKDISLKSQQHLDLQSGQISFNTYELYNAFDPAVAEPCKGPTKEPYKGHINKRGESDSSDSSESSPSGDYGLSGGFGEGVSA
jgi:hypothetical protein